MRSIVNRLTQVIYYGSLALSLFYFIAAIDDFSVLLGPTLFPDVRLRNGISNAFFALLFFGFGWAVRYILIGKNMEPTVNRLMQVIYYVSLIFAPFLFLIGIVGDELSVTFVGLLMPVFGWALRYIVTGKTMLR
jgi:hypothetical protein